MKQLSLLFLVNDNQILLAMKKRGFGVGLWNGVGGKQDKDETIEQTAIRESEEEIGVTPRTFEKVADLIFVDDKGEELQVHAFMCSEWEGEPRESEEMNPKWFSIKEIPYEQMWPDDSHWLPVVLSGEKIKGKFTFDKDDKLVDWQLNSVSEL